MSLHEPLSGGINSDEAQSHSHTQPSDDNAYTAASSEQLQFARPTPGDTPSAALCPWCPCGHVERQLGLQAADQSDSLRVWLRFGSIALMCMSLVYFLLLLAFTRWFNYPGAVALLSLCFVVTFLTALSGLWASRRALVEPSSSAAPPPWQSAAAALPTHPWALRATKWMCALPLSLLAFFLACFLGAAMLNWLSFDTQLTTSSRQQVMSTLLLGINALATLTTQCFVFLVAASMQRAGADDDLESDDLEWQRQLLAAQELEAHHALAGSAIDAPDDRAL